MNMVMRSDGKKSTVIKWLILAALAPAVGFIATFFFTVSAPVLGLILAVFIGLFLYISASDLIPESHHRHPAIWTTLSTVLGILLIFLAVQFAV